MLAEREEQVSAAVVAQVLPEAGQPVLERRPREAELLAPAPRAAAVSAALLAQVLPEARPPLPAPPLVPAQAPVLAQRQVVADPAQCLVGPAVLLSRQSFSAAMARRSL